MINIGADVVDDEVIFVVFENFEHDLVFFLLVSLVLVSLVLWLEFTFYVEIGVNK